MLFSPKQIGHQCDGGFQSTMFSAGPGCLAFLQIMSELVQHHPTDSKVNHVAESIHFLKRGECVFMCCFLMVLLFCFFAKKPAK